MTIFGSTNPLMEQKLQCVAFLISGFHSQWYSGHAEDLHWWAGKFDDIYFIASITLKKRLQHSDDSIKLLVDTVLYCKLNFASVFTSLMIKRTQLSSRISQNWLWILVASKKPPSNLIGIQSNHTEHLSIISTSFIWACTTHIFKSSF